MKKLAYLIVVCFIYTMLLPTISPCSPSLPKVPITYPGDTEKTIIRRAQWIEGAKKEGKIVWWGSIKPAEFKKIASEFNKIYPFIELDYWTGNDTDRDAKLETEHTVGRVTVDFCGAGELTSFPRWRSMGLTEKYTDIIPGIEKKDKRMFSKYGDWAQPGNNAVVPLYNTKLVSAAEAPKGWEDLLNPKWQGKIGMTADVKAWYTMALAEGGWGLEKTEDYLMKLKQQNIVWAVGQSEGHALMIAGEYPIMAWNYLRFLWVRQSGAPVDWVRVRPVIITGSVNIMPKKAPHPNAVRLLIEWLYSPQGLAAYEKITGYGAASPGSGTQLAKVLEGLPLVFRTEDVLLEAERLRLIDRFIPIMGVTPK